MSVSKSRFAAKAVILLLLAMAVLTLIGVSNEATMTRFGKVGWIHWLIGLLLTVAGLIACWAGVKSWLDARALKRYRLDRHQSPVDGQTIAVSGRVQVDGEPLIAPFSQRACASLSYQVMGRGIRGNHNHEQSQLCLLGFHLARASLDTGSHRFRLLAVAEADDDLLQVAQGGDWGERAFELLTQAANQYTPATESTARDTLSAAQRGASVPSGTDYYIAPTRGSSNQMSIWEQAVPLDTNVTLIGRYNALDKGLDGERRGGLKAFAGDLSQSLAEQTRMWRKALAFGVPMLVVGLGLVTLADWWPA